MGFRIWIITKDGRQYSRPKEAPYKTREDAVRAMSSLKVFGMQEDDLMVRPERIVEMRVESSGGN